MTVSPTARPAGCCARRPVRLRRRRLLRQGQDRLRAGRQRDSRERVARRVRSVRRAKWLQCCGRASGGRMLTRHARASGAGTLSRIRRGRRGRCPWRSSRPRGQACTGSTCRTGAVLGAGWLTCSSSHFNSTMLNHPARGRSWDWWQDWHLCLHVESVDPLAVALLQASPMGLLGRVAALRSVAISIATCRPTRLRERPSSSRVAALCPVAIPTAASGPTRLGCAGRNRVRHPVHQPLHAGPGGGAGHTSPRPTVGRGVRPLRRVVALRSVAIPIATR